MGMKQSKIEVDGEYLPATPLKNITSITVTTEDYYDDMNNPDPRSPNICRTPLNELRSDDDRYCTAENFDNIPITPIQQLQKSDSFKKKLLKGLNMFDPRSPSTFINRTPIVFKDNTIEDAINPADKSLNLNDTFSDLFIDNVSNLSEDNKNNEISKESTRIDETLENAISIENDVNNFCDPRSPTIGVDRTPIIFNDDDAADENVMIESVLETLKLNELQKPQNKQLERIKNPPRRKTRSSARIAAANVAANKMSIYNDRDSKVFSTPKKSAAASGNLNVTEDSLKRTPLGCVGNKSNVRSKSSEITRKNNKIRPLISSFDDYNLKSLQQKNIGNGENNENNSSMNNFIAKVN